MITDLDSTHADELTFARADQLLRQAYSLLNERELANVGRIFTEDIAFDDDAWPETLRGHGDMKRFLGSIWRAFPDLRFELVEGPYLTEDGRGAATRVRVSGTMDGPLDPPGFAPTGRPVSIDYGGFYRFEGERISRARIVMNVNELAVQIGAVPQSGTAGERVLVAGQRLQSRARGVYGRAKVRARAQRGPR